MNVLGIPASTIPALSSPYSSQRASTLYQMVFQRMRLGRRQGQSLVELALVSFTIVLMLAVTVDFSRAFSAYLSIGNMARAGAQAGSINGLLGAESSGEAKALIEEAAYDEQSLIFGGSPVVSSRLCTDASDKKLVQVRVTYDFDPIIAIGPISGPYTLQRQVDLRAQMADMRAEFDENCF